jgi:Na+/proline symporter
MQLLTLGDFFRVRFGPRAERLAAVFMVPGFLGWIAAQYVGLASLLEHFFGVDRRLGILAVAAVGAGYTLLGGMWSVTLTDGLQLAFVLAGLAALAAAAIAALGASGPAEAWARLGVELPPAMLEPVPLDALAPFLGWVGLVAAGALGNLPGQDLMQRVFAARCARTARRACLVAGSAYLVVGVVPVGLGLAAAVLAPGQDRAILPALADLLLAPPLAVLFVLMVVSAILSTIDSAILAPASVIAQNLWAPWAERRRAGGAPADASRSLRRNQIAVAGVAAASLAVAYAGEDAYGLLEGAYEIGLVSLLVPLALGLYTRRGGERAALSAMVTGTGLWGLHLALGWEWFLEPWLAARGVPLPMGLSCAALGLAAWTVAARGDRSGDRPRG